MVFCGFVSLTLEYEKRSQPSNDNFIYSHFIDRIVPTCSHQINV